MRFISFCNCIFVCLIALSLVSFFVLSTKQPKEMELITHYSIEKKELPKNPFALEPAAYSHIGEGPLELKWSKPQMNLPDLRGEILCEGKNGRPDISQGKSVYHMSLKTSGESQTVLSSDKIYLRYISGASTSTGYYVFSPDNRPTPLWFEVKPKDESHVDILVQMKGEQGELITNPKDYQLFSLYCHEEQKTHAGWEIGPYRADTTLFVRQKARWIGPDVFFEMHGGEEFAYTVGRQRIDFFEGDNTTYSCFVKVGDHLVWKEGHWKTACEGENTLFLPLLVVKKMDEKVLYFDLWDPEGKGKIQLSLIRTRDLGALPDLHQQFRFVGSKTWAQFIIESNYQRFILRPNDWLLLTSKGWQKISTPEEVDLYVNQKITGPLFVLDKSSKSNGKQVLIGHLFNASRTEVKEVELSSTQNSLASTYIPPSMHLPPPLKEDYSSRGNDYEK